MPELPEVETVRRTLEHLILHKQIKDVTILYPKIIHTDLSEFRDKIKNQTIQGISRRGKHLILILDRHVLVIHLRMEGRFYLRDIHEERTKHDHIIFHLTDDKDLIYHDVRKFGTMHLLDKSNYLNVYPLSSIGLEPDEIDHDTFYHLISKRNIEIKAILLDQKVVSGLGNIYVDETLFRAKIHPVRKGITITLDEATHILDAARYVLTEAILQGGTTIRTFEAMDGIHGRFQNELAVHTKKDSPCPICGHEIIKMKVKGRGTYVCPNCQT